MESEFDNIVSKKDKLEDMNKIQLKFEINDSWRKDEKITTNFEPSDDSDVINKSYLDKKLNKKDGHIFILKTITENLNYNTTNKV